VFTLLASNIGPMLAQYCAQYWAQYCPNIGSTTQRQYWPIFFGQHWANIGHKYSTNIGRICSTTLSQYWIKNCHDIG